MNLQHPAVVQTYVTVIDEKEIYDAIHQFRVLEISPC
ncbi:hypothetical protein PMO01_10945 [Pseudomonas moraviensis R28-S]|jgi:hypothetical protein|uniref:Uncharacterized protein n=1 Tax=Pseudomonas moraviensis R28-S TaxID=1395516 RepID=V8REY0_9PSED|nr:hypothetical protein PMO01_10945 [Pseudomonas moraviensis R28-S]